MKNAITKEMYVRALTNEEYEAVQQEAGKITELLKAVALKVNLVSDSVTRKEKTEESEVVRNGRIRP